MNNEDTDHKFNHRSIQCKVADTQLGIHNSVVPLNTYLLHVCSVFKGVNKIWHSKPSLCTVINNISHCSKCLFQIFKQITCLISLASLIVKN